jgi:hypothetical protein
MRKLQDFEMVGLIGYPEDGDYLAMVKDNRNFSVILGGEICKDTPTGPSTASQAAALPRYYPGASRLVIAAIKGGYLIGMRPYPKDE